MKIIGFILLALGIWRAWEFFCLTKTERGLRIAGEVAKISVKYDLTKEQARKLAKDAVWYNRYALMPILTVVDPGWSLSIVLWVTLTPHQLPAEVITDEG